MEKRVLFIDLEDGHIFTFSTNRCEYWRRREFRKDTNQIINPAGLYTSYNTIKALQLTELISPSLPWKSYPLEFDIRDEPGISHYYTFDNYRYEEASSTHSNGLYTLYFKRPNVKLVDTCDGRKPVTEVINKSISFSEIEQSTGLNILRVAPISLGCIKYDLRKMGVELHCDSVKPETLDLKTICSSPFPDSISDMIKEDYKIMMNSYYGMGGFTTRPVSLSAEEIGKMFDSKSKETKTMEKKKMTETDKFLKHLNGITITSTYSKMDDDCGMPYYIYYPEMEITDNMADTLLTILLMAKREYIHKVVFNPEKGTTTISKSCGNPITVRCRDGEFDYILGYEMARTKMYLGSDDYNWFNKIKNHRKTHIEYTEKPTEPKTKRTSKKGGKK